MARTAGDRRRILLVGDLQRLVHRMAPGACRQLLPFMVRLVAGKTGRLEAV